MQHPAKLDHCSTGREIEKSLERRKKIENLRLIFDGSLYEDTRGGASRIGASKNMFA